MLLKCFDCLWFSIFFPHAALRSYWVNRIMRMLFLGLKLSKWHFYPLFICLEILMNTTSDNHLISINLFLDHHHTRSVLQVAAQSNIYEVIFLSMNTESLSVVTTAAVLWNSRLGTHWIETELSLLALTRSLGNVRTLRESCSGCAHVVLHRVSST